MKDETFSDADGEPTKHPFSIKTLSMPVKISTLQLNRRIVREVYCYGEVPLWGIRKAEMAIFAKLLQGETVPLCPVKADGNCQRVHISIIRKVLLVNRLPFVIDCRKGVGYTLRKVSGW